MSRLYPARTEFHFFGIRHHFVMKVLVQHGTHNFCSGKIPFHKVNTKRCLLDVLYTYFEHDGRLKNILKASQRRLGDIKLTEKRQKRSFFWKHSEGWKIKTEKKVELTLCWLFNSNCWNTKNKNNIISVDEGVCCILIQDTF